MMSRTAFQESVTLAAREAEAIAAESTAADWMHLVRAEYFEIPGLRLTRPQVQRLWNLDSTTRDVILDTLVHDGFLRETSNGAFVRADSGVC
jgi:hypothetical protein